MIDLLIYLIIMLIVYCIFLNIKLIFEFLKIIGGGRCISFLFEKGNWMNVIKYIYMYMM